MIGEMKFGLYVFVWSLSFFNCLNNTPLAAQEQTWDRPLKNIPLLSGNFGELRETHFHSGIDLKTGGREGLPVICVKEGRVSRMRISATGYGKALYVEHPDGTTTVYGHLQRYQSRLAAIAREEQYARESFEVDLDVRKYDLLFSKGDTIAYSGNTGSSGGPHLHFECRDTRTETVLNPLKFFSVKDGIAPKMRALYLYYISGSGCVYREKKLTPRFLGGRQYSCGNVGMPSGKVGIGLYITDAMNDSWNKLGVYSLKMAVNGNEIFRLTVDSTCFDKTYLIHELKDFRAYRERETVYRTFGPQLYLLPGVSMQGDGTIVLKEGEEAEVLVEAGDINGNVSRLRFKLRGGKEKKVSEEQVLLYGKPAVLEEDAFLLKLGSNALFHSQLYVGKTDTLTLSNGLFTKVFIATLKDVPLKVRGRLQVRGSFGSQTVICRITDKNSPAALATRRTVDGISAGISYLGRYAILKDSIPPTVEYTGIKGSRIVFKIKDGLSGIVSYRGEVNGKWCLFEYDPKKEEFWCSRREVVFDRGKMNEVVVVVVDGVGNRTEKRIKIKG